MLYIVIDSRRSYPLIVERLESSAGATVIELDRDPRVSATFGPSKLRIVRRMMSPSVLRLRNRWTREDRVLAVHWYALPILTLVRLGYLARPEKLVVMGTFVQSPMMRGIVNLFLRMTVIPQVEFIAFSEGERAVLTKSVDVSPERVHKLMWAGNFDAKVPVPQDPPYVFTGGYANRDYGTFFEAVGALPHRVVAVASRRNRLGEAPSNVELRLDVPLDDFDRLLGGCRVLVLPLRGVGEASGQSVLTRGIRYGVPVVATRHDGVVDYLGADYSGYVPPGDANALRAAVSRVMSDDGYRQRLIEEVGRRRNFLHQPERDPGQQVLAVLQPIEDAGKAG